MTLQTTDDGNIIVNGRVASRSELKTALTFLAGLLGYQLHVAATLGVLQGLDKISLM